MVLLLFGILGVLAGMSAYLLLIAHGRVYSGRVSAAIVIGGLILLFSSSFLMTFGMVDMMGGSL